MRQRLAAVAARAVRETRGLWPAATRVGAPLLCTTHYRQSMAGLVSAGAIIGDADGTPIPPAARLPTAAWPPMVCITGRRD